MLKNESAVIIVHGGEIHGPFDSVDTACDWADGCVQSNGKKAFILSGVTVCEKEPPALPVPELHPSQRNAMVNELTAAVLEQLKVLLPQMASGAGGKTDAPKKPESPENPPRPQENAPEGPPRAIPPVPPQAPPLT